MEAEKLEDAAEGQVRSGSPEPLYRDTDPAPPPSGCVSEVPSPERRETPTVPASWKSGTYRSHPADASTMAPMPEQALPPIRIPPLRVPKFNR